MKILLACALAAAFTFVLALSLAYALVPTTVKQAWHVQLTSAAVDDNSSEYIEELEAKIQNLNSLIAHRDADLLVQEKKIGELVDELQREREEEFEERSEADDEEEDADDAPPSGAEDAGHQGPIASKGAAAPAAAPLLPVAVATALDKADAAKGAAAEGPIASKGAAAPAAAPLLPVAVAAALDKVPPPASPSSAPSPHPHSQRNRSQGPASHGVKTIFINTAKDDPGKHLEDHIIPNCPWKCIVRLDKKHFREADAVVWETLRVSGGAIHKPDAKDKKPGQTWLFRFFYEAPWYGRRKVKPPVFEKIAPGIDYTMTFKGGSDLFQPFFWTVPVEQDRDDDPLTKDMRDGRDWAQGRSMLLLGIISNCIGPRMKFWKELTALLPKGRVMLYGKCGRKAECTERSDRSPCWMETFTKYKFYFSGENNRCDGYITEKFMRPLRTGMVPLVLGGKGRGDYERIAPGNAFLHVDDFSSVEALAAHLKRVDQDDALYRSYFDWRKRFKIGSRQTNSHELVSAGKVYCTLCEQLHKKPDAPMPTHTYGKSLSKWFYDDVCIPYKVLWNKAGTLPPPPSEPRCQPGGPCA